jgi:hypothetical protein
MTELHNLIIKVADRKERDQMIQEYVTDAENRYEDLIQIYKLWSEYLARSKKFKKVCNWFEKAREKHPYPEQIRKYELAPKFLENYIFFVTTYDHLQADSLHLPLKNLIHLVRLILDGSEISRLAFSDTFFSWAVDAGFPTTFEIEMLINLFVFGNVHADPDQSITLRAVHLIDAKSKARAVKLERVIDTIFLHVETNENFLNSREASVEDFKTQLKRYFEINPMPTIYLANPYYNIERTLSAVKQLITEMRSDLDKKGIVAEQFSAFESDQFEGPMGNVRMDELERYLKTYDLKMDGKTNKEIAKIVYPNYDAEDKDTIRAVMRDRKKAEKVITNVERGFFPGSYQ